MKITMISVSRARTYIDCPAKYKAVYEEDMRTEADYLEQGTVIHSCLERLYKEYQGFADLGTVLAMYDDEFSKNPLLASYEHYHDGVEMLKLFMTSEQNFEFDILTLPNGEPALEWEFYIDLEEPGRYYATRDEALAAAEKGHKILTGFVDKIQVVDYDTIRVTDYKTSRIVKSQDDVDNDLQLHAYNLAVRTVFPEYKNVEVSLNFLRTGDEIISTRTARQADECRSYFSVLFDSIRGDEEGLAKLNTYCSYCIKRQECTAYLDVLNTPYAIPDMTEPATWESLWSLKADLDIKKKLVEQKLDEIRRHFEGYMIDNDVTFLPVSGDEEVVLSRNKRSSYKFDVVVREIGIDNLSKVVSITKERVKSFLRGDKEALNRLEEQAETRYGNPMLRTRKRKGE